MSLYIGLAIILGIALVLFILFKTIFARKKDDTSLSQEVASKEVIGKEVSQFDEKTGGDPKNDTTDKVVYEKNDDNKEIR